MAESLLSPEFLQRLEYLHLLTRELSPEQGAGSRTARKFGVGTEFADYRNYVPGDDSRHIDWNVYGKSDRVVVKLFSQEQSAQVSFLIDASPSMSVGDPSKLLFAKKIAAALAYIALVNLDHVTHYVFDSALRPIARDFRGGGQLPQMLGYLEAIAPANQTGLAATARQFVQRERRRGLVVLLSDFLDRSGYEEAIRLLHYNRHDLMAIRINDRDEVDPAGVGDLEMIDSETGERRVVQLTPTSKQEYLARLAEHYSELSRMCKVIGRREFQVVTDSPFEQLVLNIFRHGGLVR
jgi:uncharacterized protein (DUF58 family)